MLARMMVVALMALGAIASCVLPPSYSNTEVNDARLINAAAEPQNWLLNGGTFAGQYYSALRQVNEGNVETLAPAWVFDFDTNRGQESEPLVVDGVMYVTTAWSKVYAIDATSGKQLWFYDPKVPGRVGVVACCDVVNRGAAVYKGKVYVGTLDGRLEALDAKTGSLVWSTMTVDPNQPYTITGAPRVIKDKVIIGNAGADYGVRGYVSAYDAANGKLVWRFYTVPGDPQKGPDHAASDEAMVKVAAPTWSGSWYKYGGGGTVWNSISYDPDLDQLYIGTGNGSPWNPRIRTERKGDNLFLCSIVALDPDTGRYIWHYQENPQEGWDYTSVQHIMLVDVEIGGERRKALYHAPKNVFFYIIDRTNGKLLSADPLISRITWAKRIDVATGRPVENPNVRYEQGPVDIAPGPLGAHSAEPMARSPETGLIYILARESSMTYDDTPEQERVHGVSNPGVKRIFGSMTQSFVAFDPATGARRWQEDIIGGGALATAGGLVFRARGAVLGEAVAYRATDGKVLWSYRMPNTALGSPITYSVNGIQYVAFVTGAGGSAVLGGSPTSNGYSPGRVIVFRLNGNADMPRDPGPAPPLNPSSEKWTGEAVKAGAEDYQRYCGRCHGFGAASANVVPDLRRSAAVTDADTWKAIVLDGILEERGMHGWGQQLTPTQAENIRGYISDRALTQKQKGDLPPSREKSARDSVVNQPTFGH